MNILDTLVLRIPCPSCGQTYEVPVTQVLASQTMLNESCACRSENECPPLFLAPLLSRGDLDLLSQTWQELHRQAADRGGELFIRSPGLASV